MANTKTEPKKDYTKTRCSKCGGKGFTEERAGIVRIECDVCGGVKFREPVKPKKKKQEETVLKEPKVEQ